MATRARAISRGSWSGLPRLTWLAGLALSAACCWPAVCSAAPASEAPRTIALHHTSWTARDGAPPFIIAIAQTPDGWLWLASPSGVFRFDGVRFERFQPPGEQLRSNNVWGMRLLDSGALWIGYRSGGASVWRDGKLRNFAPDDALPVASVMDFDEDAAGNVWVATSRGVRSFDGARWHKPAPTDNGPQDACTLLHDAARTLWAQCESGAYRLPAHASGFERVAGPGGMGRLVLGPDQAVWSVGGPKGDIVRLDAAGVASPAWPRPRADGGTMLFDRDGRHLWVIRSQGVARLDRQAEQHGNAAPEVFDTARGLSGSAPNVVFQDREGNVWLGTENGLDRFRSQALSGVAMAQIYTDSPAIAAAPGGALWVGGTLLPRPDFAALAAMAPETAERFVTAIWQEAPDSTWIAAHDGLWHQHGAVREAVPLPPGVTSPQIHGVVRDHDGDLWISMRRHGIFRLHDGVWQERGGQPALMRLATAMFRDTAGRMWFCFPDNRIELLAGGKVTHLGVVDGLQIGAALRLIEIAGQIWLAGENGLFYFDGKRFHRVQGEGEGDGAMLGTSGMVLQDNVLWLNGMAGISAIGLRELARAVRDPAYRVRFRRLDHKDGLRGVATQNFPLPSLVAGSDHTLWFATSAGVFWLDPRRSASNALPPPVLIRSISAGGIAHPVNGGAAIALPPHPGRLQIDYTALSLTMPERMRFLYLLEGVDDGWQDGGSSRSAVYTDLGPGDYLFRVRASNNDGVWSMGDAVLRFHVAPATYQSTWFRLLCAALGVLALWGLYALRMAQVARQLRQQIGARMGERERISRELHDTFLQTLQSLILKLHVALQRLPASEPVRGDMQRALELAEIALDEGRDRVQGLRLASGRQPELSLAVVDAVRADYDGDAPPLARVTGVARQLRPQVFDETQALAREALINARRHAQASHITLDVVYGDDALVLTVSDDGCGIADAIQQAGHLDGHFGMICMRERAQRIGARLSLASSPDKGSCWTMVLAAGLAYESD